MEKGRKEFPQLDVLAGQLISVNRRFSNKNLQNCGNSGEFGEQLFVLWSLNTVFNKVFDEMVSDVKTVKTWGQGGREYLLDTQNITG